MNHHTRWLKATSLLGAQGWRDRDLSCWQSWRISQVRVCQGAREPCAHFLAELSEIGRALNLDTLKPFKPLCSVCLSVPGNRLTLWTWASQRFPVRDPTAPSFTTRKACGGARCLALLLLLHRSLSRGEALFPRGPSAHFHLSVDSVLIWELRPLRSHFLQISKPLPSGSFLLGSDVWRWHSPRCCQMVVLSSFLRLQELYS